MNEQVPAEKKSSAHECGRCGRRWHGGHDHCCDCHERELTELRASLRREENARKIAEKDAERYRWWRRYVLQDRDPLDSIAEAESLEELDAAIDAEIRRQS